MMSIMKFLSPKQTGIQSGVVMKSKHYHRLKVKFNDVRFKL